jgi:hypothetical protein
MILQRDDNTTVEIIASYFPDFRNIGSVTSQFGFYALVDKPGQTRQVVTPENGTKSLSGLSVEQYIRSGRVGLMAVVRPHELIKVSAKLKNKLQHAKH